MLSTEYRKERGKVTPQILAYEYGFLDAKHGMGYYPRPGVEQEYMAGFRAGSTGTQKNDPIPAGSYTHTANWGWY